MCQMLKVGAGVRGMLKAGTVPFPVHTALKGWHHVAPREHLGSARIMAGKRSTGRWARTWLQGRHGDCGCKLYDKAPTDLFPMRCLASAFCPSVPFSLSRTLPRHGLREGAFLTSVGTRVRPYRTLGERPVALHPRSYRTLGCVPGGGVAWCHRRQWERPMCPARKTARQHLRLHRKGLDIDVKFATKHMACTGTVHSGPTVSASHWPHNAATRLPPSAPCLSLWRMPFGQIIYPGCRFALPCAMRLSGLAQDMCHFKCPMNQNIRRNRKLLIESRISFRYYDYLYGAKDGFEQL